ncbi:MAG: hypothetical protein KatS3mg077_2807 [Candidatus Binatia bacterium]|nr:MAG: hypothetical protein KatS3mg077_2807 [Candidatus Binatia bacterium]
MQGIENVVGYVTGVKLVLPHLEGDHFWPTVLVIQLLDAILCAIFARNNGYRKTRWFVIGFVTGLWAVALLLLLTRRREGPIRPASHSSLGNHPSEGDVSGVGQGEQPSPHA